MKTKAEYIFTMKDLNEMKRQIYKVPQASLLVISFFE